VPAKLSVSEGQSEKGQTPRGFDGPSGLCLVVMSQIRDPASVALSGTRCTPARQALSGLVAA